MLQSTEGSGADRRRSTSNIEAYFENVGAAFSGSEARETVGCFGVGMILTRACFPRSGKRLWAFRGFRRSAELIVVDRSADQLFLPRECPAIQRGGLFEASEHGR